MVKNLVFVLLLLILSACSTSETENTSINRLHDIWALDFIDGEKIVIDEGIKNLPMIEIYVKDERVHGNTSCNTINGKVEIDEDRISFHEMVSTKMACPGDLEYRFLSALESINNYKIEKMRLYLFEGETERLVFRKID